VEAMRVRDVAKITGHVILSVVLVAGLISAAIVGLLFLFEISLNPESPAFKAAISPASFIVLGVLIAQWHRRVSISRRLLSFVFVCAASTIFVLPAALLQIPQPYDYWLGSIVMAMLMAAVVAQLVILGTIGTPWPIPIVRLWRGEIGLARAYWVWLSLVVATVLIIFNTILQVFYDLTGSSFIIALKVAFGLIAVFFMMVSIWRSARNYEGPRPWRVLARTACVLFGIFAVINLGGLLAEVPFFKATNDPRMLDVMIKSHLSNQAQ
jgi:hypothetical protein